MHHEPKLFCQDVYTHTHSSKINSSSCTRCRQQHLRPTVRVHPPLLSVVISIGIRAFRSHPSLFPLSVSRCQHHILMRFYRHILVLPHIFSQHRSHCGSNHTSFTPPETLQLPLAPQNRPATVAFCTAQHQFLPSIWIHPFFLDSRCLGTGLGTILSTHEAAPPVLYSVLRLSLQERHWDSGVCPVKGNGAGEGLEHKSDGEQLR